MLHAEDPFAPAIDSAAQELTSTHVNFVTIASDTSGQFSIPHDGQHHRGPQPTHKPSVDAVYYNRRGRQVAHTPDHPNLTLVVRGDPPSRTGGSRWSPDGHVAPTCSNH
jgi:hypothetical protein